MYNLFFIYHQGHLGHIDQSIDCFQLILELNSVLPRGNKYTGQDWAGQTTYSTEQALSKIYLMNDKN